MSEELSLPKFVNSRNFNRLSRGGGSGIRTHDTVSRIHAFQASAFSHSAIPPAAPCIEGARGLFQASNACTPGCVARLRPRSRSQTPDRAVNPVYVRD